MHSVSVYHFEQQKREVTDTLEKSTDTLLNSMQIAFLFLSNLNRD